MTARSIANEIGDTPEELTTLMNVLLLSRHALAISREDLEAAQAYIAARGEPTPHSGALLQAVLDFQDNLDRIVSPSNAGR